MHSPALHNDKDPYELSVISEPSVEGGGGGAGAGLGLVVQPNYFLR